MTSDKVESLWFLLHEKHLSYIHIRTFCFTFILEAVKLNRNYKIHVANYNKTIISIILNTAESPITVKKCYYNYSCYYWKLGKHNARIALDLYRSCSQAALILIRQAKPQLFLLQIISFITKTQSEGRFNADKYYYRTLYRIILLHLRSFLLFSSQKNVTKMIGITDILSIIHTLWYILHIHTGEYAFYI